MRLLRGREVPGVHCGGLWGPKHHTQDWRRPRQGGAGHPSSHPRGHGEGDGAETKSYLRNSILGAFASKPKWRASREGVAAVLQGPSRDVWNVYKAFQEKMRSWTLNEIWQQDRGGRGRGRGAALSLTSSHHHSPHPSEGRFIILDSNSTYKHLNNVMYWALAREHGLPQGVINSRNDIR